MILISSGWRQIKSHWIIIVIAISLGLATGLPNLIGANRNPVWAGVYPAITDDDFYHLVRTREVLDGQPFISNPYFLEYKNSPPIIAWLPEWVFGITAKRFGISVFKIYILADFIFPALLVLLTYGALLSLTNSRPGAVLGAVFLHAGVFFETMGHPISPQFNILFLLIFFWCLISLVKNERWFTAVVAGVALGAMINTYFYYWTFAAGFAGLLLFVYFWQRNYRTVRQFLVVLLIGLIGGAPNFYFLWQATKSPAYIETFRRFGALATHLPSGGFIISVSLVLSALILLAHYKKIITPVNFFWLMLCGGLAEVIVANQQVITGKNILFASHYRFPLVFWSGFVITYLCVQIAERLTKKQRQLFFISTTIFIVSWCAWGINKTTHQQITLIQNNINDQRLAGAFDWLTKQTSATGATVYANQKISNILPAYTSNNVVAADMSTMSLVSTGDLIERFVALNYGEKINVELVFDNQFMIWGAYHVARNSYTTTLNKVRKIVDLPASNNPIIPKADLDYFFKTVAETKQKPLVELLKKFHVRYLLVDRTADPAWRVNFAQQFPEAYSAQNIAIFQLPQ